jgi:biotin synthase
MVDYQDYAAKALRDETLTRDECQAVLDTPDEQLLELLQAAFAVRSRYFGKTVRLQMLQNAKSGACQEDCHYCSQSAISTAPIERYNLVPQQQMIDGARQAAASKAQRYRHQRSESVGSGNRSNRRSGPLDQAGDSDSDLLLTRPHE